MMTDEILFKWVKWAVIGLFALILIFSSFGTISAGERGVKTHFGAVKGVVETGLYFKLPFVEKVHSMNVKTLTVNFDNKQATGTDSEYSSLSSASKDLQDTSIAVVVNYHIDAGKVDKIYQQYASTENYQLNVIEPMIREAVKSTAAQYTAEELVTKRAEVASVIAKTLDTKFTEKWAIMETFSITNFEFSDSFNKAIESKVVNEQNAIASKNLLEQKKYEAEQIVVTAKATAEAQKISAESLTTQGGKDYVQLQWIKAWEAGGAKVPTYITSDKAGGFIMNITQ